MIFSLVQDVADVLQAMPRAHPRHRILTLLDEAVRRDVHFIDRHPTTLFQCLWNSCWWYDCPEAESYNQPLDIVETKEATSARAAVTLHAQNDLSQLIEAWSGRKKQTGFASACLRSLRPPQERLGLALAGVFCGHQDLVTSVGFLPNGRIVSASWDNTIRIWDSATGRQIACLENRIRIWDRIIGREIACLGGIKSISVSTDGRYIASASDRIVGIWDIISGEQSAQLPHEKAVKSVAFKPCSPLVASASDKTIRLWNITTGKELRCLEGHQEEVEFVVFGLDGEFLLSGSRDKTVRVWEASSGKEILCLKTEHEFSSLAISPDTKFIAVGLHDKTIGIWDRSTGEGLESFCGHTGYVTRIVFFRSGNRIASSSYDNTVRVWDFATRTEVECIRNPHWVMDVDVAADEKTVVFASGDGTLRSWKLGSKVESITFRDHESWIRCIAISPDGKQIASGSTDTTARLWQAENGVELACLRGHRRPVSCVVFSPDGQFVATGSGDDGGGAVRVWQVRTGAQLACWRDYSYAWVEAVGFPRTDRIVSESTGMNGRICLWDTASGKLMLKVPAEDNHLLTATALFSPDACRLLTGCGDDTMRLWDLTTGEQVVCLRGHEGEVTSAAFSLEGNRLVSGAWDSTVRVWDLSTGQQIHCLRGHQSGVTSVAFSPNGERLASGSDDETVRIWHAEDGREIACLQGHEDTVRSVSFSTDGKTILSTSSKILRQWDTESFICTQVVRGEADLTAVRAGPRRFPWLAVCDSLETVVYEATKGIPIAWFPHPVALIRTYADGCTWVGCSGSYLCLFRLEINP